MATKAKTVKVRVAVVYSAGDDYQAGGYSLGDRISDNELVGDARRAALTGTEDLPYACIVEIELPIPKPPFGKVLSVKAVKP
jgi:hypothetical protein